MGNDYQQFLDQLEEKMKSFIEEARKSESNKAAGNRARKIGQELRNTDLKEFRNMSLQNQKEG